jgi:hypothetical protein
MTKARILADYVAGGTTAAEFDYMDGVTSNVQTQLTAKAPLASPVLVTPNLGTPSAGVMTNMTGAVTASIVDDAVTGAKIENNPTIAGNLTVTGDIVPSTALSHRNMIINSGMTVHQRSGTTTFNNNQSYSLDRFQGFASAGGTYTITQDTSTPSGQGFINSLKVTVTIADSSLASGDYYVIDQRIEGNAFAQAGFGASGAKAVTLSFWVRSSVTGSHGGSLSNSATNRSYPYTYTVDSTDTWEYKTITIVGDTTGTWLTTTGVGARLYWGLGVGTTSSGTADNWAGAEYRSASSTVAPISTGSATWYITGVQLELGSSATPFEHRSYGEELLRCQRYYTRMNSINGYTAFASGHMNNTTQANCYLQYPTTMRGTPAFVSSGVSMNCDGTLSSMASVNFYPGTNSCLYQPTADTAQSVGEGVCCFGNSNVNAYISIDSEL